MITSKKVVIIFGVLCFLVSCNKQDNSSESSRPPADSSHLKYFGFTLIDTYWDDPTDAQDKTNYSDEVAPFSNVADILVISPSENIVSRMAVFEALQMKSILHIAELFFEIEGEASPSGNDYTLRTDYQERWDSFVATNDLIQHQNLIQTLYLGEEPTWNGISGAELSAAANYIKTSVPEIPILIIEAYPAIADLQVPDAVDWVGFDHYFVKDPANNADFLSELERLKTKLSNTQNLVLVMDAHYIDFAHGTYGGIDLNEMGKLANSYYELAKKEKKTIALLGYFWPSGFDQLNAIGARHMPSVVQNEYEF